MERLVKKFEQRHRRALDLHNAWEDLQATSETVRECWFYSWEIAGAPGSKELWHHGENDIRRSSLASYAD